MTGYQIVGLLCAFLFFAGTIGADIVFGQLLKRQYLTARTQWERDLQPMWWSWQPPGASLSKLRYRHEHPDEEERGDPVAEGAQRPA